MTTMREITQEVADTFGLSVDELKGRRRFAYISIARHRAMRLIRDRLGKSHTQIADFFGRHEATIRHGIQADRERAGR